jgi:hypothetical protein
MKRSIRATRLLVAPTLAAAVLLAACGSDDLGRTSGAASERVAAPASPRLWAQADRHERSAQLRGQALTHGVSTYRLDAIWPNPVEAGTRAAAERLERSAKLEAQARTHREAASIGNTPALTHETSDEEFVPGSRHMPVR